MIKLSDGRLYPKIDMHTHIMPENMPDFKAQFGYGDFIMLDHFEQGKAKMIQNDRVFRIIDERCWNVDIIKSDIGKFGIDVSVLCTIPVLFSYWAKPEHGLEVAKFLNDDLYEQILKDPKSFIPLGTLPMQSPLLSIYEMERCVREFQFKGFQIGSHIGDKNLSDTSFYDFYEAAEDLGCCLFIHPWDMMGSDTMKKYWLPWLVGMPAEISRAICSFIFGGIFEKFPKLRVCFAHAGGSFPSTIGRIEHGFNVRPDLVALDNGIGPREYIGKFWIDSITHEDKMLDYVLDMFGSEKICMGSDYPFPLGELDPGKLIEDSNYSIEDKKNMLYRSTLKWLGIDEQQFLEQYD